MINKILILMAWASEVIIFLSVLGLCDELSKHRIPYFADIIIATAVAYGSYKLPLAIRAVAATLLFVYYLNKPEKNDE